MASSTYSGKDRGKLVPALSILLIFGAWLASGFSYWALDEAVTLLFYAVLVRAWTEFSPDEPMFVSRDWQFVEFIMTAAGAVIIGFVFREAATYVTGDLLAVQSLALSLLLARWYINARRASTISVKTVLRYKDPVDQRLVLVPSACSFLLPVVQYQTGVYLYDFDTRSGFFGLIILSVFIGLLYHAHETGELDGIYSQVR